MNPDEIIIDEPNPAAADIPADGTATPNPEAEAQEQVVEPASTPAPETNHGPPPGHPRFDEVIAQKNDYKRRAEEAEAAAARAAEALAKANMQAQPAYPATEQTGPFDTDTMKGLDDWYEQRISNDPRIQSAIREASATQMRRDVPDLADKEFEAEFSQAYTDAASEGFSGLKTAEMFAELVRLRKGQAAASNVAANVDARMQHNEQIKSQSHTPLGGQTPPPAKPETPEYLESPEASLAHMKRVLAQGRADGIL